MGRSGLYLVVLVLVAVAGYFVYDLVTTKDEGPDSGPEVPVTGPPTPDEPAPEKDEPAPLTPNRTASRTESAPVPVGQKGVPTELAGYVYGINNRPLAGATVQVMRYEFNRNRRGPIIDSFSEQIFHQQVTGEDGRYAFTELTVGEKLTLRALAPEHISQIKDNVTVGILADFHLRRGAQVSGSVIDADSGKPVANALVKGWFRTEGTNDVNKLFRWQQLLRTDDEGRFRIEGSPIGTVKFILHHEEYLEVVEDREIVAGAANNQTFKMTRGLVIMGTLLDKQSGDPIAGADVRVSNFFLPKQFAETDEKGRFRVTGLEPGNQIFTFRKRGYSEGRETKEIRAGDDFDPEKGNVITFSLDPAGRVGGIVVDESGQPLDNAEVYVARHTPLMYQVRNKPEARTGADGSFLVGELNANQVYRVAAYKDGFAIGVSEDITVGPAELKDGVQITLAKGAAIRGTVSDENGVPVSGVVISVEKPPFAGVWFPPGLDRGQQGTETVITAEDGRFAMTGLWPGAFTCSLVHEDHVPLEKQRIQIKGDNDQITRDFTMKIGRFIAGRVAGPDGTPARGAVVNASYPWTEQVAGTATVDEEGNYHIRGLITGKYRVQARLPGFSSQPQNEVVADSRAVDFLLEANGSLTGLVVDDAGNPVERFTVGLRPEIEAVPSFGAEKEVIVGRRTQSVADPGGIFKIDDLDPGSYTVVITASRQARGGATGVIVPSGAIGDAGLIRLPRGAIFSGTVVDGGGTPVREATVTLWNLDAQAALKGRDGKEAQAQAREPGSVDSGDLLFGPEEITRSVRVDRDGYFEIPGLSAGRYRVRVTAPRHVTPKDEEITLEKGQREERSYRIPAAAQVQLTLVNDLDEPVVAALASVRDARTNERVALRSGAPRSDARGSLTLNGLTPGTYKITLTRTPDYLIKEVTVSVGPGEVHTDTVRMELIR